jgi:thymidylate synthase (FAD)
MNGTLRSWVHYLELRTKQDTQKEHRDIALAIQEILFKEFPNIAEALKETT